MYFILTFQCNINRFDTYFIVIIILCIKHNNCILINYKGPIEKQFSVVCSAKWGARRSPPMTRTQNLIYVGLGNNISEFNNNFLSFVLMCRNGRRMNILILNTRNCKRPHL